MSPLAKIAFWWVMFGGTHVLGSSVAIRAKLIELVGLPAFKGVYSVVGLATFIPLCVVYAGSKHVGAQIYSPPAMIAHVNELFMLVALVFMVQAQMTPNPLTTAAELSGKFGPGARGILLITRHPSNTAFAIFGIGHCLANPFASDWLFFGGFVIYAIVSAIHQDARMRATGPAEAKALLAETSLVPFGAIAGGKQRLAFGEFNTTGLVIAVVLMVVLRVIHGSVFGGFGG